MRARTYYILFAYALIIYRRANISTTNTIVHMHIHTHTQTCMHTTRSSLRIIIPVFECQSDIHRCIVIAHATCSSCIVVRVFACHTQSKSRTDAYIHFISNTHTHTHTHTLQLLMYHRASKLSEALEKQTNRLQTKLSSLQQQRQNVVGDVLLGSIFVTCAGPLDEAGRAQLLERIKQDLRQKAVDFTDELPAVEYVYTQYVHRAQQVRMERSHGGSSGHVPDTYEWHAAALPRACYESVCARSVENAAIALCNPKVTLFIDPDMQALSWFRRMRKAGLESGLLARSSVDGGIPEFASIGQHNHRGRGGGEDGVNSMGNGETNDDQNSRSDETNTLAARYMRRKSVSGSVGQSTTPMENSDGNNVSSGKNARRHSTGTASFPSMLTMDTEGVEKGAQHPYRMVITHVRRDYDYINSVKTAISTGETLVMIIESEHDMDVMMTSLVALRILKKGKSSFLWLGSEYVECDRTLGKIYIVMTNSPRQIPAQILASTIVVDCHIQDSGVYEHMLAVITSAMRADLESQRLMLLKTVTLSVSSLENMQNSCIDSIANLSPQIIVEESDLLELQTTAVRLEDEYKRLSEGRGALDTLLSDSEAVAGDAAQSCARVWRIVRRMYHSNGSSSHGAGTGTGSHGKNDEKEQAGNGSSEGGYHAFAQARESNRDMYVFSLWSVLKLVYTAVRLRVQSKGSIALGGDHSIFSLLIQTGERDLQIHAGEKIAQESFGQARPKSDAYSMAFPKPEVYKDMFLRPNNEPLRKHASYPSSRVPGMGGRLQDVDGAMVLASAGTDDRVNVRGREAMTQHGDRETPSLKAQDIEDTVRRAIETHVASAMFPPHRLPFAALNHLMSLVHQGLLTEAQLDIFMSPTPPITSTNTGAGAQHGSTEGPSHTILISRAQKQERMLREFSTDADRDTPR
jgi:hypothetical protein